MHCCCRLQVTMHRLLGNGNCYRHSRSQLPNISQTVPSVTILFYIMKNRIEIIGVLYLISITILMFSLFTYHFELFQSPLSSYVSIEVRWPLSKKTTFFILFSYMARICRVRPQAETGSARYWSKSTWHQSEAEGRIRQNSPRNKGRESAAVGRGVWHAKRSGVSPSYLDHYSLAGFHDYPFHSTHFGKRQRLISF